MRQHRVVLLPGDGIGPEITAVARRMLEAVSARHGFQITFNEQPIGGAAIDAAGEPLPASTLESCQNADAVLLAAIGSPRFDTLPREQRPETGLLGLHRCKGCACNHELNLLLLQQVMDAGLHSRISQAADPQQTRPQTLLP